MNISDNELLELYTWAKEKPREVDRINNGYSTKFGYHLVRLMLECEQILTTHNIELDRDSEIYKSIRRGEWDLTRLEEWFYNKEKSMETLYANSELRHSPDEDAIKQLLIECLEMHYGSLSKFNVKTNISSYDTLRDDLLKVLEKNR